MDEKGSIWKIRGLTSELDWSASMYIDAIRLSLSSQQLLQGRRHFDHGEVCKRETLIYKRIKSVRQVKLHHTTSQIHDDIGFNLGATESQV
jgi:hypothetical protein